MEKTFCDFCNKDITNNFVEVSLRDFRDCKNLKKDKLLHSCKKCANKIINLSVNQKHLIGY